VTSQKDSMEALRRTLAAGTLGAKKKLKATAPKPWFGMIQTKWGGKWVTPNPAEANLAAAKKGCRITQVFQTQEEAEAWLENIEASDDDEDLQDRSPRNQTLYDSDSLSSPGSHCNRADRRKLERPQTKKRAPKARQRQSGRESHKSSSKKAEKKKP
jgi:hypothetical protein